jgi:hypothetical protein
VPAPGSISRSIGVVQVHHGAVSTELVCDQVLAILLTQGDSRDCAGVAIAQGSVEVPGLVVVDHGGHPTAVLDVHHLVVETDLTSLDQHHLATPGGVRAGSKASVNQGSSDSRSIGHGRILDGVGLVRHPVYSQMASSVQGMVLRMSSPGAINSTAGPVLEKEALWSLILEAATAMTDSYWAG